jgi:hypothetical protein
MNIDRKILRNFYLDVPLGIILGAIQQISEITYFIIFAIALLAVICIILKFGIKEFRSYGENEKKEFSPSLIIITLNYEIAKTFKMM